MANPDPRFEFDDALASLDDDGTVVLSVVLGATFYLPAGFDRRAALEAVSGIASHMSHSLRWAKNTTSFAWERLDAGRVGTYLEHVAAGPPDKELEFGLRAGQVSSEATDFSISGLFLASWQTDPSYFRFTVPVPFFAGDGDGDDDGDDDGDEAFVSLVESTIRRCPPFHGYGGLMISEAQDRRVLQKAEPQVYSLARRFMGLEVDRPYSHLAYVREGIKSVNWLTFFDETLIADRPAITTWLENPTLNTIETERIGSTVFIRSGRHPEPGDTHIPRHPSAYIETAKHLKPIKITTHRSFHGGLPDRFTRDTSEEWLQRLELFGEPGGGAGSRGSSVTGP